MRLLNETLATHPLCLGAVLGDSRRTSMELNSMIFYTNHFVPKPHKAYIWFSLIFIHPDYSNDKGLLEHEKVHRKQFFRTFGLHGLFYLLSKKYRLQAEVEAFKEQSKHYADDKSEVFANLLSTNYNLDITEEEALTLLRKE